MKVKDIPFLILGAFKSISEKGGQGLDNLVKRGKKSSDIMVKAIEATEKSLEKAKNWIKKEAKKA